MSSNKEEDRLSKVKEKSIFKGPVNIQGEIVKEIGEADKPTSKKIKRAKIKEEKVVRIVYLGEAKIEVKKGRMIKVRYINILRY